MFLLDDVLQIPAQAETSPNIERASLLLGTEIPFREGAEFISLFVPEISPMTVWNCCQRAGNKATEIAKEEREQVFKDGVIPPGQRKAKKLHIEADGLYVKLQHAPKRKGELKIVLAYEGKEKDSKGRRTLSKKHRVAGLTSSTDIWEKATATFGRVWDLGATESVYIGGDGAAWVNEGCDYFTNAIFQLDPFHLQQNMTRALGKDSKTKRELTVAISANDMQKAAKVLSVAISRFDKKRPIKQLKTYILSNWDGIQAAQKGPRLGAIESNVGYAT